MGDNSKDMKAATIAGHNCRIYPGNSKDKKCHIYFMDVAEHPFDGARVAKGIGSTVISVEVADWNGDMTPWPMKGIYEGEGDYAGHADETLRSLIDDVMPQVERILDEAPDYHVLAGYSLGGLFAMYGFLNHDIFDAVESMSASFWYEGWVNYLKKLDKGHRDIKGLFAYLSLGDKEREAEPAILHTVQDNTEFTLEMLKNWGALAEFHLNPGSHFDNIEERVREGFMRLEDFYSIR